MYMFGVSNNMGLSDVYGFIDPQPTHEGNKFDDIQAYVTQCFGRGTTMNFVLNSGIVGSYLWFP